MPTGQTLSEQEPPSGLVRRAAIRTQRRHWQRAAGSWDDHAASNLGPVLDAVLAEALEPSLSGVAVDLGAGTGALSVPLALKASRVVAVDVSEAMLARLAERARGAGLTNLDTVLCPIEELELEPASVEVVVSNYALHHLLDSDKALVVRKAASWLRPGGRLVIGDMMLGRGLSTSDRRIIQTKVRAFARRGPAGWWRIAKNAWRYLARLSERPITPERWEALLREAGFEDVSSRRILQEAAVVTGRRP